VTAEDSGCLSLIQYVGPLDDTAYSSSFYFEGIYINPMETGVYPGFHVSSESFVSVSILDTLNDTLFAFTSDTLLPPGKYRAVYYFEDVFDDTAESGMNYLELLVKEGRIATPNEYRVRSRFLALRK
jgi:hypothetical protein